MQFSTTLRAGLLLLLVAGATAAQAQTPNGPARKRYLFAQKNPECPVVANITKNTDEDADVTGTYTHICYRSPEEMLAEINELRKIHDWADSTYQRRLKLLPAGGALVLNIRRQGAKFADPSLLTLSARTKDGKEVFAATPKPGFGRFFGRDLYQSQQLIPFIKLDPAAGPLTLVITDTHLRQQFEYQLTPQ
ncbi:hypothetical protein [Hymenobacter baengnokdamensis]|uniref:hypothetical protein n=1 Tax=Hymenobacter baengnokdamensis TaxID=2615203 RepID=UPI001248C279|nr:hypothetical protein [Hymenobacter baengnokdamensis]